MRARTDASQASPSPKFVSAKMRGYYLSVGLVILQVSESHNYIMYVIIMYVCIQLAVVVIVQGFHTPFEELIKYPHCWPLDADDDNDEPISCDGMYSTVSEESIICIKCVGLLIKVNNTRVQYADEYNMIVILTYIQV